MTRARATLLLIISCSLMGCGPRRGGIDLAETLDGALIDAANQDAPLAEALHTEHLLLYFSAHWCPPCRAFTPKLVDYYHKNHGGQLFQVLFISADRSEKEMLAYMRGTRMPWPGVVFHSQAAEQLHAAYSGAGIPRLVLINRDGRVLADSYKGSEYVGPHSVLQALEERLAERLADPPGAAETQALPTPKKIAKKYAVEGFGQGGQGNFAIINGELTSEGDQLAPGVVVARVATSHVEILCDGNTYRLYPQ